MSELELGFCTFNFHLFILIIIKSMDSDVSSIGTCRPRIFFINGFLCFLEDELQRNGKGRDHLSINILYLHFYDGHTITVLEKGMPTFSRWPQIWVESNSTITILTQIKRKNQLISNKIIYLDKKNNNPLNLQNNIFKLPKKLVEHTLWHNYDQIYD